MKHFLLILILVPLANIALAKPAPWHWWISKLNGVRICVQTPPGDGWVRDKAGIAYKNARCIDDQSPRPTP